LKIETLPEARWGTATATAPPATSAPRVDAASLTGAPLDVTPFRYSREIAAGSSGLVALPLDPAVLAHSAGPDGEFADVRIVDGSGRQVPRLVERRPEPLVVSLRAEPATAVAAELLPKDGLHRSIYRITLPYPALRDARLVIGTPAPMFQRHVTLGYERPADRGHRDPWFLQVASVEWSRTPESPAVLTLGLPAPVADATDLTLVVDEGDNSALPIGTVQMLLPSYRLRFVRPASATRLVYGASPMERPRYDLALLAPTVLAASVADVSMSPEVESASPAVKPLISPRMFWLVLVVAVAVLLGLLVLLLRRTD
jgi:hypothetical protein